MKDSSNYKINTALVEAELDGEICLYDPANYKYLNLNYSASIIWSFLKKEYKEEEIISKTIQSFKVSYDQCKNDVSVFLKKALDLGLIHIN